MFKNLIILITLFMCSQLFASEKYIFIKAGQNTSEFRNIEGKKGNGNLVGVGINIDSNDYSIANGFAAFEIQYVQKKATLENKTWPANPTVRDVVIGDINMSIGYLELPFKVGYFVNLGNSGKLKMFTGPSLLMPIVNKTKIKHKDSIDLEPEEREQYKFDYERVGSDEPTFPLIDILSKTRFNFHFGVIMSWAFVNMEVSYSYALFDTKDFTGLNLKDKVDTIYLSLGIEL